MRRIEEALTSIQITLKTRNDLKTLGKKGEAYEDLIRSILIENNKLKEEIGNKGVLAYINGQTLKASQQGRSTMEMIGIVRKLAEALKTGKQQTTVKLTTIKDPELEPQEAET